MGLANALSVLRILLVPIFVLLLVERRAGAALLVFAVAALTDLLDGWAARRSGATRVGAFLDPLADKLLVMAAFVTLAYLGAIPRWMAVIVIGRDVILVVGAAAMQMLGRRLHPRPTLAGKLATLSQVLAVLLALLGQSYGTLMLPEWFIVLVVAFTVVSCVQYLWQGVRLVSLGRGVRREDGREATHSR